MSDELTRAAQVAVAAAAAWWLAQQVLGGDGLYAPVAAVVATGAGQDRTPGRVAEILVGMILGVGAAEALVGVIGSGVWQVALVTGAGVLVARLWFDDPLILSYAGLNAAVLVALGGEGWPPMRLMEAMIGSVVAYIVVLVLMPPSPRRHVDKAVEAGLSRLSLRLGETAVCLATGDADAMAAASRATRDDEEWWVGFDRLRSGWLSTARLSPWRQREEGDARGWSDRALAEVPMRVTVLARAADALLRADPSSRPDLGARVERLAAHLNAETARDADGGFRSTRRTACGSEPGVGAREAALLLAIEDLEAGLERLKDP
jgi:hypothetical protein